MKKKCGMVLTGRVEGLPFVADNERPHPEQTLARMECWMPEGHEKSYRGMSGDPNHRFALRVGDGRFVTIEIRVSK